MIPMWYEWILYLWLVGLLVSGKQSDLVELKGSLLENR